MAHNLASGGEICDRAHVKCAVGHCTSTIERTHKKSLVRGSAEMLHQVDIGY